MGVRDDGNPDRQHVNRTTEAAVITEVRKLERQRESGNVQKPGRAWTLERWMVHWYENIAEPTVRYKTQTYYRTAVTKYIIPGIGAHRIDWLESEHVERFYNKIRKDRAKSSTLLQVHRTLRASLNEAERREKITKNPITVVRRHRRQKSKSNR
jgi:integrase